MEKGGEAGVKREKEREEREKDGICDAIKEPCKIMDSFISQSNVTCYNETVLRSSDKKVKSQKKEGKKERNKERKNEINKEIQKKSPPPAPTVIDTVSRDINVKRRPMRKQPTLEIVK